ncbi:MAG: Sua5/YciO/YrdC/YwlC family protein [Proteobacteria bacterium]|nr:Sua5/YciO/YrdC/YwlC family protein [Pseudomonadota bacterium]
MNKLHLKQAIRVCENGGIIAYPTEAVFGLGCLPVYEHSIRRILSLKRRSARKGLILVAANIEQLHAFVDFSKVNNMEAIHDSWPGPVTWLIPARYKTPFWLTGNHKTLAVRVCSHPLVQSLCERLGPIVSTSANPKGVNPARTSQRVRSYFQTEVDYVIPASITNTMNPTEIRDALTGDIIRVS